MAKKRKAAKPRKRDYKAEYRRRLALGARRGMSVQESRGRHSKEKPAKRERLGPVAKKIYTGRFEVGEMRRKDAAPGFKFDKKRGEYFRKVSDLRVYRLTAHESADASGTSQRLSRNAYKTYGDSIFSVRFLVSKLPYGNVVLDFGWTFPEAVDPDDIREDLRLKIYTQLLDDEPDEGRRTLIVALALQ